MTGQELKEKILVANVPLNQIAERLGITAQSLNSCFKGKDVRSNTIERIAEVLGVKMSFFYPMEGSSAVASGANSVVAIQSTVSQGDSAVLQERVRLYEKLLDEKERTIKILMERCKFKIQNSKRRGCSIYNRFILLSCIKIMSIFVD